jgi:tRNA pseudouridine38-40 synthase
MAVGSGERDAAWLAELLQLRDRTRGAETAVPDGLYLAGVDYPARFGLASAPPRPFLFPD